MKQTPRGVLLLLVQLALVLSVAGKYLLERQTRPRVWVRTAQYDPEQPLRGRYLSLQPVIDACALPHDKDHFKWTWQTQLAAQNGKLVPVLGANLRPENEITVTERTDQVCSRASAAVQMEYFLPEHALPPLPLPAGHELWVEVTVPASGPPRPIQMAISGPDGFKPLTVR